MLTIKSGYDSYVSLLKENEGSDKSVLHLSKDKENIIVLFYDKAISTFLPYIFEQFPDLQSDFDGFVYYPNCISFGARTMLASPAMVGGYEYTPEKINERSAETLIEKHNEAFHIIPDILSDAGYDCLLGNPPYLNYAWGVDDTGFTDNPKVHVKNIRQKAYVNRYKNEHKDDFIEVKSTDYIVSNNMISFTMMLMLPPYMQRMLYGNATYYREYMINAGSIGNGFMDNYALLYYLSDLTSLDNDSPTYSFLGIESTHEPFILYGDSYTPKEGTEHTDVAGTGTYPARSDWKDSSFSDFKAYHINAATMLQTSKFLKYLKSEGIYDNTRIIIISDHGAEMPLSCYSGEQLSNRQSYFNPLLLIKDFDNHGAIKTDNTFTTNAELINYVLKDLNVSDENPFTGNKFQTVNDFDEFHVYEVRKTDNETRGNRTTTTFDLDGGWGFSVKGNIFDESNWTFID